MYIPVIAVITGLNPESLDSRIIYRKQSSTDKAHAADGIPKIKTLRAISPLPWNL